jgi:hypothetical protein
MLKSNGYGKESYTSKYLCKYYRRSYTSDYEVKFGTKKEKVVKGIDIRVFRALLR